MDTPHNGQDTHVYVRNLLGNPDDPQFIFNDLTEHQRMGLALVRLADEIGGMKKHGCERLNRLERWYTRVIGGMAALAGMGTVILIVIAVAKFVNSKGG